MSTGCMSLVLVHLQVSKVKTLGMYISSSVAACEDVKSEQLHSRKGSRSPERHVATPRVSLAASTWRSRP